MFTKKLSILVLTLFLSGSDQSIVAAQENEDIMNLDDMITDDVMTKDP